MYILNRAVRLLDEEEVNALIINLKETELQHRIKFEMLVVDTVSKSMHGAKEDEEGIGRVWAMPTKFRRRWAARLCWCTMQARTRREGHADRRCLAVTPTRFCGWTGSKTKSICSPKK